jgi:hypothetical protein
MFLFDFDFCFYKKRGSARKNPRNECLVIDGDGLSSAFNYRSKMLYFWFIVVTPLEVSVAIWRCKPRFKKYFGCELVVHNHLRPTPGGRYSTQTVEVGIYIKKRQKAVWGDQWPHAARVLVLSQGYGWPAILPNSRGRLFGDIVVTQRFGIWYIFIQF